MPSAYYELDAPLGEGGFGSVFQAIHRPTGLPVAVKLLRRADPDSLRLLLAEASALAKVRHPNVAQLLDVGRTGEGVGFLVMELVKGHDFEQWLDAWPGWPRMVRALTELLDGLCAAHAAGVVHRDLKPPNLLVDERDGALRLVDFGIATVRDPLEQDAENGIAGTPEFMAPEQLGGGRALGSSVDLYAFGVLLHHVVRGGPAFDDAAPLPALLLAKQQYVPPRHPEVRPGLEVPPGLDALIDALLAPEPRSRPRFAASVKQEFEGLASRVQDRCPIVRFPSSRPVVHGPTIASGELAPARESTRRSSGVPLTRGSEDEARPRSSLAGLGRLPATDDPRFGTSLVRLREQALVGREEERAVLSQLVHRVRETNDTRLLVLLGEPGIGKSRLARWGLAEVERHGLMQSAAVGYELEGVGLGGGLGQLVARLVGPAGDEHAYDWLLQRDPEIDVARLMGLVTPTHATLPTRAQMVELARRVIRAASRDAPLYLWIDDLGWAHDGAIELVASLLEEGGFPILVVATLRASTAAHTAVRQRLAPLFAHPRAQVRTLPPLGIDARRDLAQEIAPLIPEVADALAASADGSPLLLVQLIHDWLEAELLVSTPAGMGLAPGHDVASALMARPPTKALDARIERMLESFGADSADAEATLVRAALLGASFDERTLRASAPSMSELVAGVLDRAVLAGLLRAEEGTLGFEHGLVQENLLTRLERRSDRRAILFDTANGLQAVLGKDRADVSRAVAELLRRAGRVDAGWDRLHHAIERSAWNGDEVVANSYLQTAHAWEADDVAQGLPSRRAQITLSVGYTHYLACRYDEALDALGQAHSFAQADGDEALMMRSDALVADVAYYQDRYTDSERLATHVRARAHEFDDPDSAADGWRSCHRLSEIAVLRGDLDAAYQFRLECVSFASRSGIAAPERLANLGVVELLVVMGELSEAERSLSSFERSAEGAADLDHQHAGQEMRAFLILAVFARAERSSKDTRPADVRHASDLLEVRLRSAEALGDRWRVTGLWVGLALAAVLLDDEEAVRPAVESMLAAFDAVAHDGPRERFAMGVLMERLEARGMLSLAQACRSRVAARDAVRASLAR